MGQVFCGLKPPPQQRCFSLCWHSRAHFDSFSRIIAVDVVLSFFSESSELVPNKRTKSSAFRSYSLLACRFVCLHLSLCCLCSTTHRPFRGIILHISTAAYSKNRSLLDLECRPLCNTNDSLCDLSFLVVQRV